MAEGESSILTDLINATGSNTRDFVINGALQLVVNAITGGGDLGKIQEQLDDISSQLNEIEQIEEAILNELAYIEEEMAKNDLMEATATIKTAHDAMKKLIQAMAKGAYDGKPKELAASYKSIVDGINIDVPKAALLISENDEDFLDQLLNKLRQEKTDILNYHLILCYAIYKFSEGFQMAITITEFCAGVYAYMEGYKEDFIEAEKKLLNWKATRINGALSELVARLVDKNMQGVGTSGRVACYGNADINEQGHNDASYWLHHQSPHVVASPMTSDDGHEVVFVKVDDFDIQNPVFNLLLDNPVGSLMGLESNSIAGRGDFRKIIPYTEDYQKNTENWQLLCCESEAVSAEELKEYFCFYNPQFAEDDEDYGAFLSVGTSHPVMKGFSRDDPQQFWHISP